MNKSRKTERETVSMKSEMEDTKQRARYQPGHYPMPVCQRAKQFMPFAAVTGLEPALRMQELEMGYDTKDGEKDREKGR